VLSASRRVFLLAAAFALLALPAAVRPHVARATSPTQGGIGALRLCGGCASNGGDLSRYGYVILNSWDAPRLPALKAQNPGLKALVYKNLTFTVSDDCVGGVDSPYLTAGVGYCDADQHHPDWFLTDASGTRLNSANYPHAWMMDVGNSAYQQRWLSNVIADVRAGGWDGVFMDDTDTDMGWHLQGRTMARYPTSAAWRSATRSMLASVGPGLTSASVLAVPNLYAPWAADYDAQATWQDWIQFTSGAAQEYYTKWGMGSSGWFSGGDWTFRQQFQALTEQAGKIFLGITYAPKGDLVSMNYARANFLLLDDPANAGALLFEPSDPEAQDPYASAWTADIGRPSGARFQAGAAWRRNYTGGTVLVNPSTSSVTVGLEQPYVQQDGTTTMSVTLAPTTGAVLWLPGGGQPPPPPPPDQIVLNASVTGNSVLLTWTGMSSPRTDVFRNGRRIATVANTGTYLDRLQRRARGSFTYRVCAAGTSTCSADVTVRVGSVRVVRAPRLRKVTRRATGGRHWVSSAGRGGRAAVHSGRSRAASR
jgi:Hypothetical glycosyl hydrolase family 15